MGYQERFFRLTTDDISRLTLGTQRYHCCVGMHSSTDTMTVMRILDVLRPPVNAEPWMTNDDEDKDMDANDALS